MSVRTLVVLALAIICGGSSAAGVFLMRNKPAEAPKPETVSVVVATRDIARGEVIGEQLVAARDWPAGMQPPSSHVDTSKILNRTALTPIMAGEPVLEGKVADLEAGRGLAALIPEGHRAYTIQTSHVGSNVAGFVMPGNRVDVLLTLRGGPNDKTGGGSSTTLLQAVEILAVDQRLDAPTENRVEQLRSVTLLVTPEEAALLDLGHNMGTLALSLRNPSDTMKAETKPATVNVLRFTQKDPAEELPNLLADATPPEPHVVQKPVVKKKRPRPLQTYTLRGRSTGRILVQR